MSGCTPSQTVGPFFHFRLIHEGGGTLAPATAPGRITIEGRIVDGAGSPVPDAFLEIWQADAQGRYRAGAGAGAAESSDGFDGFGRAPTDATGRFVIETIKPGAVPGPEGRMQAPHLLLGLFGRGLLTQLITRLYFEDEQATAQDPILELVPAARRDTLIARRVADGRYEFDIVLQGAGETVFFQV
jgi:protocatechuate 3,4-dioxygenase alpha subunit